MCIVIFTLSMDLLGTVIWFDDARGYGFVRAHDGGQERDFFLHYSQIISDTRYKSLEAGAIVEFVGSHTEKGYQAHTAFLKKVG